MERWPEQGVRGPMAALDERDVAVLRDAGRVRELDRDDVLVHQGAQEDHVAVLLAGRFRVVVTTTAGRDVLLAVRGPGDVVGELAAVDGAPRSATVSALEPARALIVRAEVVRRLAQDRPRFAWALLETTVGRLRESDRRFVGVAAELTRTRVARTLLEIGAQHGRLDGDAVVLDLPLSQAELAGWVGASREGVSGALGELRKGGLITTSRMATTIVDVDGLREVALGA